MKRIRNFFYPHESNNYRARLLHLDSLLIIILCLIVGTFLFSGIKNTFPSVLGISTGMTPDQLLALTNEKRIEQGLSPVTINGQLSAAAEGKARDMLTKNYWAHNSPDGTTPWDFIKGSGYSYVYAGENLARGFSDPSEVVNAWMASPEHRQNMLSPNFNNIGFAIATGSLTGEDTVLVVEMLGSGVAKQIAENNSTPQVAVDSDNQNKEEAAPVAEEKEESPPVVKNDEVLPVIKVSSSNIKESVRADQTSSFFDSLSVSKNTVLLIIYVLIIGLLIDVIVIEKKKIIRFASHNIDHIFFLIFVLSLIFLFTRGFII